MQILFVAASIVALLALGKRAYLFYLTLRRKHRYGTAMGWAVVSWAIFGLLVAVMFGN